MEDLILIVKITSFVLKLGIYFNSICEFIIEPKKDFSSVQNNISMVSTSEMSGNFSIPDCLFVRR
jgi:hypothetical protein